MSAGEILLWVILPYAGDRDVRRRHVVALPHRPVRLDERVDPAASSSRILGWAGPAFHYGALAAIGGHVIGLLIPKSFTDAVGISESTYRWFSAIAGAIAGAVCVVGFLGLVYRRATNARVRRTTSRTDLLVYFLLAVLIGIGCWLTFAHNLLTTTPTTTATRSRRGGARCSSCSPTSTRRAGRDDDLPGARDRRLGVLGAVPVQPPRARVEHPAAVPRPPVHPLPPPLRRSAAR